MEDYKLGIYIYFDQLVLINSSLFPLTNFKNIIRCSKEEIEYFNNLLEFFFETIKEEQNLHVIIERSLNLVGILWYYQPFFDGNTRTLQEFLKNLYLSYGLYMDMNELKKYPLIPIFYEDTDRCSKHDIERFFSILKPR